MKFGHMIEMSGRRLIKKHADIFMPGEEILYVGSTTTFSPYLSIFIITSNRIIAFGTGKPKFDFRLEEIAESTLDKSKKELRLVRLDGTRLFLENIPKKDLDILETELINFQTKSSSRQAPVPVREAVDITPPSSSDSTQNSTKLNIQATKILGSKLSKAAEKEIANLLEPNEIPWLILNPFGATGLLVALENRLAIIKTGAATSFMAGSFMGSRTATFYYTDITGIEFNSGMFTGVLEILTPSYDGSKNKDYWQGTFSSRNANSNDPYTLSNTLPVSKQEYREWSGEITELKKRIASSKSPQPVVVNNSSVAEEISKLAQLKTDGVLSEDEFAAAKARLLSS
jgi:hypothetical protein